jgi:hypothetical protein
MFKKLLNAARIDALPDRESQALELRYGLVSGSPRSLEEVGSYLGLTRERARQIILRAHHRIVRKALEGIASGEVNQPTARLALYTRAVIRPESGDAAERLATFVIEELGDLSLCRQAVNFVASLAYMDTESAGDIASVFETIRDRCSGGMKHATALERWRKLLSYAVWPTRPRKLDSRDVLTITGQDESLPPYAGSFYSGKMSRAVKYNSELEMKFYRLLEHADDVLEYHVHPLGVPCGIDGKEFDYYPDLFLLLGDHRGLVVDIMPTFWMALSRNLVKFEILEQYCREAGLGVLVTDGHTCLEQMRGYTVNQEYAGEVICSLKKRGVLNWNTYRPIRDEHHAGRNDFVGLVLQNRLVWQLKPFSLSISR